MELEYKELRFECKALEDKNDGYFRFSGSGMAYGNVDSYNDIIHPGAATKSLKEISPIITWYHSLSEPLGIVEGYTDGNKNLSIVGKLPIDDTFVSGRVIPQIKVGSVPSLSVGYHATKTRYEKKGDKKIRHIDEMNVYEFAILPFGANDKAKITGFKSTFSIEDVEEIKTKRDFEKFLRDSGGFSKKAIAYLASCLDEKKMRSDSAEISTSAIDAALSQIRNITKELKGL